MLHVENRANQINKPTLILCGSDLHRSLLAEQYSEDERNAVSVLTLLPMLGTINANGETRPAQSPIFKEK